MRQSFWPKYAIGTIIKYSFDNISCFGVIAQIEIRATKNEVRIRYSIENAGIEHWITEDENIIQLEEVKF